ncbi:fibrobacter succinogenes major paralogous domain-containing protein [Algoriphagus taiwanensis]|uniref:Fibrobacter succinogenes major paralogous domain-containing protein n=1 Tax=Algoriphagus taiwanensis TaxID=1445656 RepID=A0ABQ6Q2L2_9BACT|nr:hypothetical protein Ataiwa_26860 [Algoriphagus taiwanensis]
MRKISYFIFLLLLAVVACNQEEVPVIDDFNYQGSISKEFFPYQIRYFSPGPLASGIETVTGFFGEVPIEAGVTEKNEVVFKVPDLPPGKYQLKLDLQKEIRVWDVTLVENSISPEAIAGFWSNYFEGSAQIKDSLSQNPTYQYFLEDVQKWSDHFLSQYSNLSSKERNELIYLIYQNGFEKFVPFSLQAEGEFENCLDEKFTLFQLNTFEQDWELNQLKARIAFLPKSTFNDAFLSFLGDLILRNLLVQEFLGSQIFICKIVKEVDLKSKFGVLGTDPLLFNSGNSLALELTGGFSPLRALDGSESLNGLGAKVSYIKSIKNQNSSNRDLIFSIQQERNLELPTFSFITYYDFPLTNFIEKRALTEFEFEVQSISNPGVSYSKGEIVDGKLYLAFSKLGEGTQEFDFVLDIHFDGFQVSRTIKGIVVDESELILDLFFDSGTAFLQVFSGMAPLMIEWSNGIINETQATFNSGNHSVIVRGGGEEIVLEFFVPEFGEVMDREGNEYTTVKIGDRWWMAENLRNTIRIDGRPVPRRSDWPAPNPNSPQNFDFASYSPYINDSEFERNYGYLYNLHALPGCLCPDGWEIPTTEDFEALARELGGAFEAGKMLKKRGSWEESYPYSSNESGFNARAGGLKNQFGSFESLGVFTGWWARNSANDDLLPNTIALLEAGTSSLQISLRSSFFFEGHYIRCIKKE